VTPVSEAPYKIIIGVGTVDATINHDLKVFRPMDGTVSFHAITSFDSIAQAPLMGKISCKAGHPEASSSRHKI